jgi:hypothetical protein
VQDLALSLCEPAALSTPLQELSALRRSTVAAPFISGEAEI